MTFWQAFKATYGGSVAFLIACPVLALFPVAFELLQHGVEVHIGMYDSIAAAKASEHHPLRMAFGLLKIVGLIIPTYWVTRYLPRRDARFAGTLDAVAVRLVGGFLVFYVALVSIQLFVLPQTVPSLLAGFVASQVIGALVTAWAIAAALGNGSVGPWKSVQIMAPQVPWTVAFSLVVMLPLMIPHYALGAAAIFGPRPLLWPILIADSLLVGWLTAVLVAGGYYAGTRAATKAGIDLAPTKKGRPRRTARFFR